MKCWKTKTLFDNKIQNIKNSYLKNYLVDFLNLKNILIKISSLIISIFVIFLLFFVLRDWALNNYESQHILFNKGWSFGNGSNLSSEIVYVLKSLPTIIFFLLFLFINKWYLYIPICIISISSLCNIIDKSLVDSYIANGISKYSYDTVVDYFYFSNFNFTNNIGDIFIIIGVVLIVCSLIYYIIHEYSKVKSDKSNEKDNS